MSNALNLTGNSLSFVNDDEDDAISLFLLLSPSDVLPAHAPRGEDADAVRAREHHRPQGRHLREPGGQAEGETNCAEVE